MDILIVEPLFEKTKKLSQMVVSAGCTSDHVLTARDALNKLRDNKYVGVLVSYVLPDMSGNLFSDMLKGMKTLTVPPVLMVKSPDDEKMGIEDYLKTILRAEHTVKSQAPKADETKTGDEKETEKKADGK